MIYLTFTLFFAAYLSIGYVIAKTLRYYLHLQAKDEFIVAIVFWPFVVILIIVDILIDLYHWLVRKSS